MQIEDMNPNLVEPSIRAYIEVVLDRRDKTNGPVYLITVKSIVHAAIQLCFGDGHDYRRIQARFHKNVAERIEQRGGKLWKWSAGFADRIYQIRKET